MGRCKKLMLKMVVQPLTSTPAKETPPHHQVCRPGKTVEDAPFLRPKEAYELGMRIPPAWHGKGCHIPVKSLIYMYIALCST